jgi:NAD(P)-dependent dehydrogenase (short-subunit alcohol dehydrogenase family)
MSGKIMQLSGLDGKNALVTGASRGIGRAIAEVMAACGVRLICCARSQESLEELCDAIGKKGGVAVPVKADVASPQDRETLAERILSEFGGADFLINNAGIHVEKDAFDLSDEQFFKAMEINFFSMFSLARELGKQMIQRGGGKIVNMGSFWGQLGVKKQLPYCAAKAAIEAMTRCLAVEWARHNIQVNTVAPGHIMTDISKAAMENEKIRDSILRRIPARRVGEPEEVAYLVAFLCSEESSYLTGHIYYIDGGQQIAW